MDAAPAITTPTADTSHPDYSVVAFAPRRRKHCLIIAVWNEGDKLRRELAALQPLREHVDILISDRPSDDGATDADYLRDKVTALLVKTNPGGRHSTQRRAALDYALKQGYEGFVTVDGNDKDGVESIPRFVELLEEGYDLIQGSRFMPGGAHANTPVDRELAIKYLFNPIMRLGCGFGYTDGTNGFRAYSRRYLLDPRVQPLREVFKYYSLEYYLNYRAPKLGLRVVEIPVRRVYPQGTANYSKINGLPGRLHILFELILTVLGYYNPR